MSAAMMMTLSAVLMLAAAALLLASVMVDRPTPAVADEQRVVQRIEARLMRGGRTLWRRQTQRRARADTSDDHFPRSSRTMVRDWFILRGALTEARQTSSTAGGLSGLVSHRSTNTVST